MVKLSKIFVDTTAKHCQVTHMKNTPLDREFLTEVISHIEQKIAYHRLDDDFRDQMNSFINLFASVSEGEKLDLVRDLESAMKCAKILLDNLPDDMSGNVRRVCIHNSMDPLRVCSLLRARGYHAEIYRELQIETDAPNCVLSAWT